MHPRLSRVLLFSLVILGMLPLGCKPGAGGDLQAEVQRLTAELDGTRQRLAATEKALDVQKDGAALAASNADAMKKLAAETEQAIAQKDAQIRALQTEVAELKNRDGLAYAEISAVQQKGLTSIALDRYQQFVQSYPDSPLVADANRAIADLTPSAERDAKWKASLIDPKKQERELLKRFSDGIVTPEELAPLLKRRSSAEVAKMLGAPNKTFRNGTEFAYVDKVIDSSTGDRGTLVITFESDRVMSLRVGYTGRAIKPQ